MNAADWQNFFNSQFDRGLGGINRMAARKRAEELRDEERAYRRGLVEDERQYRDTREERIYNRNREDRDEDLDKQLERDLKKWDEIWEREFDKLGEVSEFERETARRNKAVEYGLSPDASWDQIYQAGRARQEQEIRETAALKLEIAENEAARRVDEGSAFFQLDELNQEREENLIGARAESQKEVNRDAIRFRDDLKDEDLAALREELSGVYRPVEEFISVAMSNPQLQMQLSEDDLEALETASSKGLSQSAAFESLSPAGQAAVTGLARQYHAMDSQNIDQTVSRMGFVPEWMKGRSSRSSGPEITNEAASALLGEEEVNTGGSASAPSSRQIAVKWGDDVTNIDPSQIGSTLWQGVDRILPVGRAMEVFRNPSALLPSEQAREKVAGAVGAGREIREIMGLQPDPPPEVDIPSDPNAAREAEIQSIINELSNPLTPPARKQELQARLEQLKSPLAP
jgi:hypothetical protein